MFYIYQAICDFLEQSLDTHIQLEQSPYDPMDDEALHAGQYDIVFICGLPLVRLVAQQVPLEACGAPILSDKRYHQEAVYFAELIVKHDSRFYTLADLQGSIFCYNDIGSNSGHHLLRHHLYQQGYPAHFFGQTIASGAHTQSLQMVIEGKSDCATIDSVVLAQVLRDEPSLATQFRVVKSIGPCPVPPMAIVGQPSRLSVEHVRHLLNTPSEALVKILTRANMQAFAPISHTHYQKIGDMYETVERANYVIIRAESV
jgi:phosphonate transport system substrate-binding protein